jgi:hypothetical protein
MMPTRSQLGGLVILLAVLTAYVTWRLLVSP